MRDQYKYQIVIFSLMALITCLPLNAAEKTYSACEDQTYLELQKKGLHEMTVEERDSFDHLEKACDKEQLKRYDHNDDTGIIKRSFWGVTGLTVLVAVYMVVLLVK